ncbi:hypothetical protein DXG01_005992 [Tephrocybe rancida]|nr:hypothetical protein DXG01_005992 [Tephrocybe rancida]
MPPATQRLIPTGYTFLNHNAFLSLKAKDLYNDLNKQADNRNPDAFDMYIYNSSVSSERHYSDASLTECFTLDFFSYAVLDLVDKNLASTHAKITKKAYEDAFYLLEGLVHFNDYDAPWPMCDDGDRVQLTNKAYGALVVAMLRGLESQKKLNSTDLPSLESFLKITAAWADQMEAMSCDGSYGPYCKVLGKKLFGSKTPEDFAREKALFDEWIAGLSAEDQAAVKERMAEDAEEEEATTKKPSAWYAGPGDVDEDDLVLSRAWKEYKAYLGTVPKKPMKGPGWDISKWSGAQKKQFAFDKEGDSDSDY